MNNIGSTFLLVFFLPFVRLSTLEDAVYSSLSCIGVNHKSYECVVDLDPALEGGGANYEDNGDVNARLDQLTQLVQQLNATVINQQNEINNQQTKISTLETKVADQNETITSQENEIETLENTVATLNGTQILQGGSLNSLNTSVEALLAKDVTRGFHVYGPQNPTADEVLIFASRRMDVNLRYNMATGQYSPDVAGMYYLSVYALWEEGEHGNIYIRKGVTHETLCLQWGEGGRTNGEEIHSACDVVTYLTTSDTVEVYMDVGSAGPVLDEGTSYTGFTGFLIHAD